MKKHLRQFFLALLILLALNVTLVIAMGWLGPNLATRSGQRVVFVTWALFFLCLFTMSAFHFLPRSPFLLAFLALLSVAFFFLARSWEFGEWLHSDSRNQDLWMQLAKRVTLTVVILILVMLFFKPPSRASLQKGSPPQRPYLKLFFSILALAFVYFAIKLGITFFCWQLTRAHLQASKSGSSSVGVLERAVEENETSLVDAQFEIDFGNGKSGKRMLEGKALAHKLDAKLNELLGLENTIRYAFLETTPTSESLTLDAFRGVWDDEIRAFRKEDNGKSKPVHLVELPIEDEARMVKTLREQKELFQEVVRYVNVSYTDLHVALIAIDIFLGKSFGIHIAMYLLFFYCIGLFRNPGFCRAVDPHALQNRERIKQEVMRKWSEGVVEKILFCRDALPQLGFIGTLLGLSMAILNLGEEDTVQIILQRPGISPSLAASLGLAFNTTLIALLLVILMGLYFARLSAYHLYYQMLTDYLRKQS